MRDPLPIHHDGRVVAGPSEVVSGVEESVIEAARIALLHGIAEGDVYRTGQNSWSPAGWRRIDEEPLRVLRADRLQTADDPAHHDVVRHHSSWMMVVTGESGSVLLGCMEGETPRLRADTDVLTGWTETGRPGTWVLLRGAERDVLARYRALLADRHGAMTADPGAVWCSWYSLYEGVSQALLDDIVPELPGLGFDREAAYRQAIATIRDAVGPDVFLLGSGAPIFPSLGILDAVRTGPDVAPLWSHFVVTEPTDALGRNALVNATNRLWLRGLIGLDPDVVYFQRRQNLLTPEQRQWLLDCATLSGFRAVSDLPDWLESVDRDAVRDYLASRPNTRQLSRYRYAIDERIVDFSAAVDGLPGPYPL